MGGELTFSSENSTAMGIGFLAAFISGLFFLSLPSAPQANVAKMKAHGEGGRNGS